MHHPLPVLPEGAGVPLRLGRGGERLDTILILLSNRHWVLVNTPAEKPTLLPELLRFPWWGHWASSCCNVERAAQGMLARLSYSWAFKPDWEHWE